MRNAILGAAMFGMYGNTFAMADTGAPAGGGTAVADPAATPAATPAADAPKPKRDKSGKTLSFDTLDALKAHTLKKGYRRYGVKVPAFGDKPEQTLFFAAREPDKAVSEAAEKMFGLKAENIDRPEGSPVGRPRKSVDELLTEMPAEERARILAKFLGGNATPAAVAAPAPNGDAKPAAAPAPKEAPAAQRTPAPAGAGRKR